MCTQMFRPEHVDLFREKFPGIKILVHPECSMEVVDKSDVRGSTSKIIKTVDAVAARNQMGHRHRTASGKPAQARAPEQEIHFLSPVVCMCATMYRIDLGAFVLES